MKRLLASASLVVMLIGFSGPVANAGVTDTPPPPGSSSTWE
jgi:hypothetical protein